MAKKTFKKAKIARKSSAKKTTKTKQSTNAHAPELQEKNTEEANEYMNEFIKALTDLAKEATIYLAKKNGSLADALETAGASAAEPVKDIPAPAKEEAPKAPAKPRGRPAKAAPEPTIEDPLGDLGLPSEPAKEEAPALTEEQSKKLLMDTATDYVKHFGKPKGYDQAKAHLKPYKVEKITDLDHKQRQEYSATLRTELTKAGA